MSDGRDPTPGPWPGPGGPRDGGGSLGGGTGSEPREPSGGSRGETEDQRADRNWAELLQELRVTQMGVQILTGFLLTLPFQQRFADLDETQRNIYLCLVVLSVLATGLLVAPVALHRLLFRKHLKTRLVTSADRLARVGLVVLALVVAGTVLLIFDVVVGLTAGVIAAIGALVLFALLWVALPLALMRRARRADDAR